MIREHQRTAGFWILIGFLVCIGGSRSDAVGNRYFPLEPRSVWSFGDGRPQMQVVGVSEDEQPVYTLSGGPFASRLRVDEDRVVEITEEGERLVFDLGAGVRDTWTIEPLRGGFDIWSGAEVELISRSEVVEVPFGTYREVLHFGLRPRPSLADAGLTDIWLAPDIGLVQWMEIWFGGVRTLQLQGFRSGGNITRPPVPIRYSNQVTISQDERTYSLGLERETYHPGEQVRMRYIAALDTEAAESDSATYGFNSTQQVEFAVSDSGGRQVWVWSAGRGFGEALTSFTLHPGDSRRFDTSLLVAGSDEFLVSRDQVALPPGSYWMEGLLPTSNIRPGGIDAEETRVSVPFLVEGKAASEVEVRGGVVEVVGREVVPVPGAQVTVTYVPAERLGTLVGSAGIGPTLETETDENGEYQIGGLIPGLYRVVAQKEGWHLASADVQLRTGVTPLRLALTREDPDGFDNSNSWDHGLFRGELATNQLRYSPEDSVHVRYRLIHTGRESVTLLFSSGQQYDLTLDGRNGRLWKWSDGRAFTQALGSLEMAPGDTFQAVESFVLDEVGGGDPGSYLLESWMTAAVEELDEDLRTVSRPGATASPTTAAVKFIVEGDRPIGTVDLAPEVELLSDPLAPDDSLNFVYRLENTGEDSVQLAYPSSQEFDIVLEDSEGWVWVWSSTRRFAGTPWERDLGPGESIETIGRYLLRDLGVVAGESYVLRVYQTVDSGDVTGVTRLLTEARASFRLSDDPEAPPDGGRKLAADFDGDRRVNFNDFLMFSKAFGSRPLVSDADRKFDLDNDGAVGFEDFLLFAARFGETV